MSAIERIKGVPVRGQKTGNWIDIASVRGLLDVAKNGVNGMRNVAMIACMVGCGLRRAEVAGLDWGQWRRLDGRWCICDLRGKGGRVRTVPAPEWVAELMNAWKVGGEVEGKRIFPVSAQDIYLTVCSIAARVGIPDLRPHDLRRTWSRLALAGGASIEQISQVLGHASIDTTQRYLNLQLETRPGLAACDFIQPYSASDDGSLKSSADTLQTSEPIRVEEECPDKPKLRQLPRA